MRMNGLIGVWGLAGCLLSLVCSASECEYASVPVRIDVREEFGGRMAVGTLRISPIAEQLDGDAALNLDGQPAPGWSAEQPMLNVDGLSYAWHQVALQEGASSASVGLAVVNPDNLHLHEGALQADERWTADRVHVVRHWVRVPVGMTLTIEPGAVVKFCQGTGIQADGQLVGESAIVTVAEDDAVGGDTDMAETTGKVGSYELTGNVTLSHCVVRYQHEQVVSLPLRPGWNLVSLPADIPLSGNENAFEKLPAFVFERGAYRCGKLPLAAGTALWLFSFKEQTLTLKTFEERSGVQLDSASLRNLFVGVPSSQPISVKRHEVTSIWQWNQKCYELLKPGADGSYILEPRRGYIVFPQQLNGTGQI